MSLSQRRVLVTGHCGFTGGWLTLYLSALGAEVHGYGRERTVGRSFYGLANVAPKLASEQLGDLLDLVALRGAIRRIQPHVVFHLAARAIVSEAAHDPVGTIRTNVMGTTTVLDAVRTVLPETAVVYVSTDKSYRNDGRTGSYRETDRLGGNDPYGASKSAADAIAHAFRETYGVPVFIARSGNVIGGGDWGNGRLVPTFLNAAAAGTTVRVRDHTRPFYHVLDAISGYVRLAEWALGDTTTDAWEFNFGPTDSVSVLEVARVLAAELDAHVAVDDTPVIRSEATLLAVDVARARRLLGWVPRWDLKTALRHTLSWYQAADRNADMDLITREQIVAYREALDPVGT